MTYRLDLAAGRKWWPSLWGMSLEESIARARLSPCARVVREDGLEVFCKSRLSTARLVSFDGEKIQ